MYLYIKKSKFLNKKQLLVHFVPCHHLIYVNVSSLKILERAYVSLLSFSSKGPSIKDVGISLAVFDPPPPPPCRNFDPDLPNFHLLISCNIGISDPPSPLKYSYVFYGWPLVFGCSRTKSLCFAYVALHWEDMSRKGASLVPHFFYNVSPVSVKALLYGSIHRQRYQSNGIPVGSSTSNHKLG